MPPGGDDSGPNRAALVFTALVLAGYLLTLAPTVTFWDAGEFIAAARTLGIPHQPGTPMYVMIAHVWGMLDPLGEYAARINLLSALLSAAGAGCLFLVLYQSLREWAADLPPSRRSMLRILGAGSGALLGAFSFTNWQNSNETEVYAVATCSIAAMVWLAVVWRRRRGTAAAPRVLLLIIYLAALSIGNHLLALLAGPALVVFLAVTLRDAPAEDAASRLAESGQVAMLAGMWALLVGTGLGSVSLVVLGAVAALAASLYAARRGAGVFALASLAIALVGVTPYLYLYLRSAQHPIINEAAPATFDALVAVVRRAQYPPRTPLDDPTVVSGVRNPGRTLLLLAIQLGDYLVYFDWQWARSLRGMLGPLPLRTLITLVMASLGIRGALVLRRSDRAVWWLLLVLFLVTGLGLVLYMNFRPGFGRWYDIYPRPQDHEVRERDYFFVVSFIVWGLWAGVGAASLARAAWAKSGQVRRLAPLLLLLPVLPLVLNWKAASRRQGADARLAADFAYDLLNSAPPYGILFTYGDNDTFPLWWAQEVAGIRQDVSVVCLALANTDWYMRQLRDRPARPLDLERLPPVWRPRVSPRPDWPLHTMTDSLIRVAGSGYLVRGTQRVALGPVTRTLRDGTFLYPNDLLTLEVIRQNLGRRPIVWAMTTGREFAGLSDYVIQRGLGFELLTARPDTTSPALDLHRFGGVPLDLPTTERLVWDTYRYAGLLGGNPDSLETSSASAAASLSLPFAQLVYAYASRGERERMLRAADRAGRLSPDPDVRDALRSVAESVAAVLRGPR
ncbi:MAG TPA: DUF2723 domain-containing protein [Gemmatimonadales bacterium]|nr:DUF2723 domain-containing protein [Gemmatimonadales bacterium]